MTTAVKQTNKEMVMFLVLEMKANVNITIPSSYSMEISPLVAAISNWNETLIKLLFEELGANVNFCLKRTDSGPEFLPIHAAMFWEAK